MHRHEVRVAGAALAALTALGVTDCKGDAPMAATPPAASVSARAPAPSVSASAAANRATPAARAALASEVRGTIGAAGVVARLHRDGDRITGSYFYEKAGGVLELSGAAIGAHVTLDEVADTTKTGVIEADMASDGGLEGAWLDAKKQRSLPLRLRPIPVEASPASALLFRRTRDRVSPVVGGSSKGEACKTRLEYAEAFGLPAEVEAKVNAKLSPPKELLPVGACDHSVDVEVTYKVGHNADGLLSVGTSGWVSDSQAAHPDSFERTVNVLLATGADARLFGDVLGARSEGAVRRELAAVVDAAAQQGKWDADVKPMVMDGFGALEQFVIDPAGLRLCSELPHVMAALGGCQYLVPAARLPKAPGRSAVTWGETHAR